MLKLRCWQLLFSFYPIPYVLFHLRKIFCFQSNRFLVIQAFNCLIQCLILGHWLRRLVMITPLLEKNPEVGGLDGFYGEP
jgi:hypothetical protein